MGRCGMVFNVASERRIVRESVSPAIRRPGTTQDALEHSSRRARGQIGAHRGQDVASA
jgi:hypothetical protein